MKRSGFLFHWLSVLLVSAWMTVGLAWLLLRGRLDRGLLWRTLRASTRRRWRGELGNLRPEQGHCFVADIPPAVPSDADIGSRLVVLEDGVPLPLPHRGHDEIRRQGLGRYSHWSSQVYFTASDGTDPRTNGRKYTAEER